MTHPAFPEPAFIETNGIRMAVYEQGEGPPVVLLHGFPELAFSWRHQLPALAAAGYRAIAPDMRGYGGSDKPPAVTDYTVQKLIGDVCGLMDALELDKAVIIGHDWGALVSWQMALLSPERMAGLINLNIPFFKRPPINPITYMRWMIGKDFYIVNFQRSDEADRSFDADPGKFIDRMMRRRQSWKNDSEGDGGKKKKRRPLSLLALMALDEAPGEPLLDEDELRIYAEAFAAGGFTAPINWYRNMGRNWKSTKRVEQVVRVPTYFIGADSDPVVAPRHIEAMKPCVPDLDIAIIENCGHWTQQEKPDELNVLLTGWLARHYPV